MTFDQFLKEIQFHKPFLLDMRDYEIDFLMHAADEYKFDKTELMYAIVDYREKHKCRERFFFKDKKTGKIYKSKKDYFLENNLPIWNAYKKDDYPLEKLTLNDLDKIGVDFLEL
ncbi:MULTISPECIES: hypothetical protein [unclassified Fusobacterium]|uniref:hypothetical protein n=1 Tax=unclassified Fusobacterium TaxID=2648384 RepID=UPI001B8ABF67|nr:MULTISPECIES: hypothetical protein [unclassified Fusobacterium]MBR8701306.1 hypothetical protein [Fusobacterium sp. DD45]MBR8711078.1 hypothetical protein [Fusobacterium sp. DD28]MBR8751652.1 hypothetical protein [Fusobacterium sp. DD26]